MKCPVRVCEEVVFTTERILKKPLTEANVLDALRAVTDPDLHRDIVSLNFVKDVKIDGGKVSFKIELTTPSCPVKEDLKAAAERVLRDEIDGVDEVAVEITSNVRQGQGGQRAAEELGMPFLEAIPIYTPIRIGGYTGTPVVIMEPAADHSEMIRHIARNIPA